MTDKEAYSVPGTESGDYEEASSNIELLERELSGAPDMRFYGLDKQERWDLVKEAHGMDGVLPRNNYTDISKITDSGEALDQLETRKFRFAEDIARLLQKRILEKDGGVPEGTAGHTRSKVSEEDLAWAIAVADYDDVDAEVINKSLDELKSVWRMGSDLMTLEQNRKKRAKHFGNKFMKLIGAR